MSETLNVVRVSHGMDIKRFVRVAMREIAVLAGFVLSIVFLGCQVIASTLPGYAYRLFFNNYGEAGIETIILVVFILSAGVTLAWDVAEYRP